MIQTCAEIKQAKRSEFKARDADRKIIKMRENNLNLIIQQVLNREGREQRGRSEFSQLVSKADLRLILR